MAKTVQIRIYTIRPDRLDEWIEKFRELVAPLRRELGFEIQGSWVDRERSQHIWVIAYHGEVSFEEANAAYWASPKRADLGVDPALFIVTEETHTVDSVL